MDILNSGKFSNKLGTELGSVCKYFKKKKKKKNKK